MVLNSRSIILLLCLSALLPNQMAAQSSVIEGQVLDAKTNEPLPFSNIYINNSTFGMPADVQGGFRLSRVTPGPCELVGSFVGYKDYHQKINPVADDTLHITIRLEPDLVELESVEVTGTRDKEWEAQLKKFTRAFLGESAFAKSCTIVNPWVLEFSEVERNHEKIFEAVAAAPLEIQNPSLGYRIRYDLKTFEWGIKTYNILGDILFREIITNDQTLVDRWNENRRTAYHGSLRHLLRDILTKQTEADGFTLYLDKPSTKEDEYRPDLFSLVNEKLVTRVTAASLLAGTNGVVRNIRIPSRLEVHDAIRPARQSYYRDLNYAVSWIDVKGGMLQVNEDGVVINPGSLVVAGQMNMARVGDLLPNDYRPAEPKETLSKRTGLQWVHRYYESVVIHSDRNYYYPGETIWFQSFFRYNAPELMDSLSRVLYVDLIDPQGNLVSTRIQPVDSARSPGHFALPDNLPSGTYWIRGYTQWMLNYSDDLQYFPIYILNSNERPAPLSSPPTTESTIIVNMTTEQDSYSPYDKITIHMALLNKDGTPVDGDFSVAVIDDQALPDWPGSNILSSYARNTGQQHAFNGRYQVEKGITVSGTFFNSKNKKEKAGLTLIQGDMDDYTSTETDSNGAFWVSGFECYDSTKFYIQAVNRRGKAYGTVQLQPRPQPLINLPKDVAEMKVLQNDSRVYQVPGQAQKKARLLEEVVITSEMEAPTQPTYGKATYSLDGKWLRDTSAPNILMAIQNSVPGLLLIATSDANGNLTYHIRFGGPSNFYGGPAATEPLLLINNVPISTDQASTLSSLSPASIARVDIYKNVDAGFFGVRGGNGVIAVYLLEGNASEPPNKTFNPQQFQSFTIKGFDRTATFPMPDYSNKVSLQEPDGRTTIFWTPTVRTFADGEATVTFYAADQPTRYRIEIQGVTIGGIPFSGTSTIGIDPE